MRRRLITSMKNIFVGLIALLALLVLAFPSVLPDFIPLIGALDEAAATAVLLACARYFGFDLARFFGRKGDRASDLNTRGAVDVDELK